MYDHSLASQFICEKNNKIAFTQCMRERFSVGSNFDDLRNYLLDNNFREWKDRKKGEFYFRWDSGNLSNYKITVYGCYDQKMNIINLEVG
ncbi:MAG: hypothetical protein EAZ74_06035 [Alphaproteobacteria bacterium]|nr:MAG: hypothetical protein EAZ74_06035 [Alphaproteobacteria bacterium]